MTRSTHIPIGVPAGLSELVSERKTRLRPTPLRAAFAVEGFGPRNLGSLRSPTEAWPEPEIWQRLMTKLPWGHTTRVLGGVNGRHRGPGRSKGVLPARADSGANL
jgi:hypothetical protein